MDMLELQVSAMDCGGCERRIGNVVRRVEGVRDVDANHRTGTVRVRLRAGHAGRAAVVERIEASGYQVADPSAATAQTPTEDTQ